MKISAAGRILFWRGGSLWIGLAGEPAKLHAHHAVQIALPFPGSHAQLQCPSQGWRSYTSAMVPADHPHAFEARGQFVAQIFIEPESQEGRQLRRCFGNEGIVALPSAVVAHPVETLADAYRRRASDAVLIDLARSAVDNLYSTVPQSQKPLDARIGRAVEILRQRPGDSIPLSDVAAAVHLSPERFRHLFMQEVGVGLRPYLLWQRLERALAAYVAGETLTEAAHTGGFADSAHFSRTFRRMFGLAPASVRPE